MSGESRTVSGGGWVVPIVPAVISQANQDRNLAEKINKDPEVRRWKQVLNRRRQAEVSVRSGGSVKRNKHLVDYERVQKLYLEAQRRLDAAIEAASKR